MVYHLFLVIKIYYKGHLGVLYLVFRHSHFYESGVVTLTDEAFPLWIRSESERVVRCLVLAANVLFDTHWVRMFFLVFPYI